MHAMVLKQLGKSLKWTELPDPQLPIIPGHEIVGRIDAIGPGVVGMARLGSLTLGQRVGIPWLGHTLVWLRCCMGR